MEADWSRRFGNPNRNPTQRAVGREPGAAERVAVFIDYQNVYMRAREAFFGHYSLIRSESHALVSRLCHERRFAHASTSLRRHSRQRLLTTTGLGKSACRLR